MKPLAAGGQKWAFAAKHAIHGDVALKIFHPGADVERAQREIDAIRLIASPRVPAIHANGVADFNGAASLWVIEQWVNGRNLRDVLIAAGPLAPKAVLALGVQVLEVIAAAEASRIVHRDIKPENILMDANGTDAWVLDFGIARHLDLQSLTATGMPGGPCTVGYAPPEQYRNWKRQIDARADLFAIAVTLYEAIEGTHPFKSGAKDLGEVLRRVEAGVPPIQRVIEPTGGLKGLVHMMGRPRVAHRIGSAAEALGWMRDIVRANGG